MSWSVNRWDPILQGVAHFPDRRLGKTQKRGDVRRAWRTQTPGGERILREADEVSRREAAVRVRRHGDADDGEES